MLCVAGRALACLATAVLWLGLAPAGAHAAGMTAMEALAALGAPVTDAAGDPGYQAFLQAIAGAYGVSDVEQLRGRVDIAYISNTSLDSAPRFYTFAANKRHSAASTVKVVLLAALIRAIEYTGETKLTWGTKRNNLALSDHAKKMVRVSDNNSANTILDVFSLDGINDFLERIGFNRQEIEFQRRFSASAKPGPPDNYATAAGLAKFWFLLAQTGGISDVLSATGVSKARQLLSDQGTVNTDQHYNDRLNGKFPDGVEFAHKTGSNVEVIGDGGIVFDSGGSFIITAYDRKQDRKAMARLGLALLKLHRAGR